MIKEQLLSILQHPNSGKPLHPAADCNALKAEGSDHLVPIVDGIPVFWPSVLDGGPSVIAESTGVSVLILARNDEHNIGALVGAIRVELEGNEREFEIVVIDEGSRDSTVEVANAAGATVYRQKEGGYAQGLIEGLIRVKGRYIITLHGDCSDGPQVVSQFLRLARPGQILIGSNLIKRGGLVAPSCRRVLSRLLSYVSSVCLNLPIKDVLSGCRLYARETLQPKEYEADDFSIRIEPLVRAIAAGYRVVEIPLPYKGRAAMTPQGGLLWLAKSFTPAIKKMWLLRHDANAADYDNRAFDSKNLIQRFWQRRRYLNIRSLAEEYLSKGSVLDVGCGSSRIIQSIPHAVAFDASLKKLRYLESTNSLRVCGSAFELPFKDGSFDCVIHSQLIEHLPMDRKLFTELRRIIRPGGTLVLGTVDFGLWIWPLIEKIYGVIMPHAYAEEHISHYTLASLCEILRDEGFVIDKVVTILKGEITIRAYRM